MAYAVERGSRRFVGSGGVIVVHVTLAYLLVFGLAAPEFIAPPETRVTGVPIPPPVDPPPPEEKTQPEPQTQTEPVHIPDSKIDVTTRDPVPSDPPIDKPLPPIFVPQPPVEVRKEPEIALFTPILAKPINDVLRWVTPVDYPRKSITRGEQGTTRFKVQVDARGKATDCAITSSSGSAALDEATCKNVMKRAKFAPATDKYGLKVPGSYSNSVNWVLPE